MKTLTRVDLRDAVRDVAPLGKSEASDLVEQVLDMASAAIVDGEGFQISSFGSFRPRKKPERVGCNPKRPQDGVVVIAAMTVVRFRPSDTLRRQVDQGAILRRRVQDNRR